VEPRQGRYCDNATFTARHSSRFSWRFTPTGVIGDAESHRSIGNVGVAWVGLRLLIDTAAAIGNTSQRQGSRRLADIPPGTRLRKPARQAGRGLLCSNYRGERVLGVRVRIRGVFPKLSSDKGEECVSWPGDAIVAVRRKSGLSVASSLFAGRSFSPADFGDIFAAIESVSRIKKWRSTCCFSRSRERLYRRIIRTRRSDTSRHHRKFFLYLS
jgi:hypothetical protein